MVIEFWPALEPVGAYKMVAVFRENPTWSIFSASVIENDVVKRLGGLEDVSETQSNLFYEILAKLLRVSEKYLNSIVPGTLISNFGISATPTPE